MTHNKEWVKDHAAHAEYNRDASLAAADLARLRFRSGKRYADFREWKDNVKQAWAMRRIVKSNREGQK